MESSAGDEPDTTGVKGEGWVEDVCRGEYGPPEVRLIFSGREDGAPLWAVLTAMKLRLSQSAIENPAIGPYILIAALDRLDITGEPILAAVSIDRKSSGSHFQVSWDYKAAARNPSWDTFGEAGTRDITTLVWIPGMSRYVDVGVGKLAELKGLEAQDNRFTHTAVLPGAASPESLLLAMHARTGGQPSFDGPWLVMPRGPFAVTWMLLGTEPSAGQKGPLIRPGGPLSNAVEEASDAIAHDAIALLNYALDKRNLRAIDSIYPTVGAILQRKRRLNGPETPGPEALSALGMMRWPVPGKPAPEVQGNQVQFGLREAVFADRVPDRPEPRLPFAIAIKSRWQTVASPESCLARFVPADLPWAAVTLAWQLTSPQGQSSSHEACIDVAGALTLLGIPAEAVPVALAFARGGEVIHYGCLDPGWAEARNFEGHLIVVGRGGSRYLDPLAPDLPVLETMPFDQALLCGPLTEGEWTSGWSRPIDTTLRAHYRRVEPEYEESWRAGQPRPEPARAQRLASYVIELLQWDGQLDRVSEADYPLLADLRPMVRGRRLFAQRTPPAFGINGVEVPWPKIQEQATRLLG